MLPCGSLPRGCFRKVSSPRGSNVLKDTWWTQVWNASPRQLFGSPETASPQLWTWSSFTVLPTSWPLVKPVPPRSPSPQAAAGQEPLLAAAGGLLAAWSQPVLALPAPLSWRVPLLDHSSWAYGGTTEAKNCWPESHPRLKVVWTALVWFSKTSVLAHTDVQNILCQNNLLMGTGWEIVFVFSCTGGEANTACKVDIKKYLLCQRHQFSECFKLTSLRSDF